MQRQSWALDFGFLDIYIYFFLILDPSLEHGLIQSNPFFRHCWAMWMAGKGDGLLWGSDWTPAQHGASSAPCEPHRSQVGKVGPCSVLGVPLVPLRWQACWPHMLTCCWNSPAVCPLPGYQLLLLLWKSTVFTWDEEYLNFLPILATWGIGIYSEADSTFSAHSRTIYHVLKMMSTT